MMQLFSIRFSRLPILLLAACLFLPLGMSAQDAVGDLLNKSRQFFPANQDSALHFAKQAVHLAVYEESDKAVATAVRWRGKVKNEMGLFQEAKADFQRSLEIESILRHPVGKAKNLLDLAHIYIELDTLDSARVYFNAALVLLNKLKDRPEVARTWLELGKLDALAGDLVATRKAYRKALKVAHETEQLPLIALANQRLGFLYLDMEKYALAQRHLRDALASFEQLRDKEEIVRSIYGLASVDRLEKKYTVAEDYARRGLKDAQALGSRGLTMQFYQLLGDLMRDRGRHEAAANFYQLNNVIRDSLLGNADAQDLSNVIAKFEQEKLSLENEKKAQEIELHKTTIELGKKELQNERLWFYFILAGLILMVLFGVFLARAVILKNRSNHRLQVALDNLQRAQDQLIRSEKLASLGQVTAGIAHEIRNPLNFVNSLSRLSVDMVDEVAEELTELRGKLFEGPPAGMVFEYFGDIRTNTGKVLAHGQRASRIVTDMLQHAGSGEKAKELVEVNTFVEAYVQLAFHSMRGQADAFDCQIAFSLDGAAGTALLVRSDLGRALLNIVGNAFEAMAARLLEEKEGFRPRLGISTRRTNVWLEICVADNGRGVPPALREKVFEPFFTTKPPNKGTGLGLSLAYKTVVEGHQGELVLREAAGGGAEFVLRIPVE